MTKKSNLLIFSLFITIGLFIYLTIHHYSVKLGLGGMSLCEINSKVNCDAAATSSFAEMLGIPIAILGGVFNFILLSFVLFYELGWVKSTSYLRTTVRGMLIFAIIVSLISGGYSLFILKILCPFCVATYLFSLINLILGWNHVKDFSKDFTFANYFGEYKSHLVALICVPLFSWVIAGMVQSSYGLDRMKEQIPEIISIWQRSPKFNFDSSIGLSNGVENPRVTIVEFADFKCPHCKVASNTIDTYLKGRPDILFVFKPYPLDGNCNTEVSQKGDNSRCELAAFSLCAEKISKKGWELHHWIFKNQEKIISISNAKKLLPEIQQRLNLDEKLMSDCADSIEIHEVIKKSVHEGGVANVEGTPTIYVNGKKLSAAQYLDVLKTASEQ